MTRGGRWRRYHSRMSKREDDIPRERGAAGNERRIHAWAAAWGLAEGTFFFIVPDVWLSWVALRRARTARKAALSALAGALAGGALVHGWARRAEADVTRASLLRVPAITPEMIAEVEAGLERGMPAMVLGPLRGSHTRSTPAPPAPGANPWAPSFPGRSPRVFPGSCCFPPRPRHSRRQGANCSAVRIPAWNRRCTCSRGARSTRGTSGTRGSSPASGGGVGAAEATAAGR